MFQKQLTPTDTLQEDYQEQISFLLSYNSLITTGFENFQENQIEHALQNYQDALFLLKQQANFETEENQQRYFILQSNIGILLFQICEYYKSIEIMEPTLEKLKQFIQKTQQMKNPQLIFVQLKILSNLCIAYIVLNIFDKCQSTVNDIINLIYLSPNEMKVRLFQHVMYIFYRFESFEQMQTKYFINAEEKFTGPTLGCYYSSMGLNRELNDQLEDAFEFHKRALNQWQQCGSEAGFMLLTLRRLIFLGRYLQQAGRNQEEYKDYENFYRKLLQSPQFQGINEETLFENSEIKIACAKELTLCLHKLEEQDIKKYVHQSKIEKPLSNKIQKWKQALKLRLCRSKILLLNLTNSQAIFSNKQHEITQGIQILANLLNQLESNNSNQFKEEIKSFSFVKQAVNTMKHQCYTIIKYMNFILYRRFFRQICINTFQIQRNKKKRKIERNYNVPQTALPRVFQGEFLLKCHRESNGRQRKFIKLATNGILKWAEKEAHISNQNKAQFAKLENTFGLIFGKQSTALTKKYNSSLQHNLCFSIVLEKRCIDFYCSNQDQIKDWVLGLSNQIKKYKKTQNHLIYNVGQYYWRLLYLKLLDMYQKDQKIQNFKVLQKKTFTWLILYYDSKEFD